MAASVPKTREHDFPKKNVLFLNFIGLVKTLWILYPSEIMYMGSTGSLLVRAAFSKSIKVLRLQPGAPKSREHDFPKKKRPDFLKFIGPVTPLLVLYPSVIMHLVLTDLLLASPVFARSIKVFGWQPGAPKFREHDFPKKKSCFFFNFIGPVTPPWVLYPSEFMHMGLTERLLARAVFAMSINVLGWQPGAPKTREHGFPTKRRDFLKLIGPVAPPWVLYRSEIMLIGFTEPLLARAAFANSIKVLGWQAGAPKSREHDFPKKNVLFFEFHRTCDTSMGSVSL